MILTELTSILTAQLPTALLREHLRLGTGFAEDGAQDLLLEAYLRAAISAVEGRTGVVLLSKTFSWGLTAWRHFDRQALPVRPVSTITVVKTIDVVGIESVVDSELYRLCKDDQAPEIASTGLALPVLPTNGSVEIAFDAGYGPDWEDVPPDLARAVIMLAADFYENRVSMDATSLPPGILALLERFRPIRVFGGV
ncbi:MAG: hypothetical protein KUG74_07580 [Rhodobacteraceae bacterium]|nr:hypothetical protein [Paracoccaceae bacterium]